MFGVVADPLRVTSSIPASNDLYGLKVNVPGPVVCICLQTHVGTIPVKFLE